MVDQELDTARIDYILGSSRISSLRLVACGLGSGGAVVVQQLTACGAKNWSLYDPDTLEAVNLVKHPGLRAELGRPKTEIMREWILDRNPRASVNVRAFNAEREENFIEDVANADCVICAVDNAASRAVINEICVENETICVSGMVFRTGLGGEIYAYVPGETGCFLCKHLTVATSMTDIDSVLDLTDEEKSRIYGLDDRGFVASALGIDVSLVACYHAHYVASLLLSSGNDYLSSPSFNWLTIGLRRLPTIFESMYETQRRVLRPLDACPLGCARRDMNVS